MSQDLYTLSLDSIRYVLGLIRDLASVSEAINNTNLADDKVFSNLYTKKLIDKCLEDANTEAQKLVGALTHLTCEETTVQPTLDNSSINVIYLYSSDGNAPYQQYLKISDTKLIDLGSTSISLTNYLTSIEIARDYTTRVEFDALKTKVDGKVDKTDIVDNLTSTDTDKPLSANQGKVLNDTINEMKTNFQNGVDTVYDAVVAKGTTPVDKSPSEIADAISKMGGDLTSIYNALSTKGLPMSGTESDDQIASIITDLMTIKSFTSKTDSTTFVFNGTKDTIKDTELVDTSSGLKLEFSSKELTSVESGGYIEFDEIDKAEYNNRLKFV